MTSLHPAALRHAPRRQPSATTTTVTASWDTPNGRPSRRGSSDGLLLVPFGIALAVRLIPPLVLAEARQAAAVESGSKPKNWLAAAVIVVVWVLLAALGVLWAVRLWR